MASATMGLRRRVPMGNPPASLAPAHHSTGKRSRSENNNSPSHGNLNSLHGTSEPSVKKSRSSAGCVSSTVSKAVESVSQGSRRGSANLRSKNKNCQLSTTVRSGGNSSTVCSREDELTSNYSVLNNSPWSVSNSLAESVSYSTMSGLTVSGGQNNLCNASLGITPAIPYMTTTMATFVGNATNLNKNSPVSYLDISNMTSGSLTSTNGINSYASSTSSEAAPVSAAFSAVPPQTSGNLVYSGIKQLQTTTSVGNKSETIKKPFHNDSMFNAYQPWVIKTYGDLAKTKTITIKKYARILRTLRGEEVNSAENSKFRFWVKSKGFHIGQPEGYDAKPADRIIGRHAVTSPGLDPPLYVPTQLPHNKSPSAAEGSVAPGRVYKKVAIVENFFDIIHAVHVDLEGRPGKHAGQKRTYRTITETYAFLPREAVTRFLLGCTECQRRPRTPSPTNLSNQSAVAPLSAPASTVPSVLPVVQSPTPLVASPVRPNCEASSVPEFKAAQYPVPKQPKLQKVEKTKEPEKKREKEEKYNPLSISNILKKEPTPLEPELRKTPESDRASSRSSASSKWRRMIPEGRTPSPPPSQPLPRPWSPSLDPKETPIDYSLPITTMYLKHQRILAEKNKAAAAAAAALQDEQKATSECTDRVENSLDRDSFSPAAGLIDTNLNLLATIQHLHCQVMLALTERLRPSILPEPLMLPPATAFLPPGLISAGMSIPSALAHNQFS